MTAPWSHGVGKVRNGICKCLLNSGSAQRKMNTEASAKGDQALRIVAGDEETRRLMRVLHEEVIARIETIARG